MWAWDSDEGFHYLAQRDGHIYLVTERISVSKNDQEPRPSSESLQASPLVGDAYVDSCFQLDFEELEERREWRRTGNLAEIPRLASSGEERQALALIEEEMARYPDFDFLYVWRGHLQGKLGMRDEQRGTYLEGVQKCRSKMSLCDQLGQWEFETEHLDEAVRWWIRSCVIQLSTERMEYAQPFLRLAYIAEGLQLAPCRPALLEQVDRIDNVRLNAEAERECWRLAESQGNDSVKRAVSWLCESYLWGSATDADEFDQLSSPEASDAIESPEAFRRMFEKHLQRMRSDQPVLRPFLDQYFSESWMADLSPLAEDEMQQTLTDGDEHGVGLSQPPVYYQICTLRGTIEQARDWFARKYGGYTKALENLWNSLVFSTSGCSVLCHIVYLHVDGQTWVHLAICPVGESPPLENWVTPVEFLSAEERRRLGVEFE